MSKAYKNRYGDIYTFTLDRYGNLLWEGAFLIGRIGFPNVYKVAYQQFRKDGGQMNQFDFEEAVHKQIYDEDGNWIKKGPICEDYGPMVFSDNDNINMVDPSGGPYIDIGTDMGRINKDWEGKVVTGFVPIETGYKLIIC